MSGFPLAEVVLLWQSVFNFPNWLFHECLIKNQANHNLSFDECKMQGSGWRLKHTRCFAKEILQVSPQYSVFLASAFPWLLIPYSTYARTYFVSRRQWNTFHGRWIVIGGNKSTWALFEQFGRYIIPEIARFNLSPA